MRLVADTCELENTEKYIKYIPTGNDAVPETRHFLSKNLIRQPEVPSFGMT